MLNLSKTIIITLLMLTFSFSADSKIPDVSGLWQDKPASTLKDTYLLVSQSGTQLKMIHQLVWNGKPFIEEGIGTINSQGEIEWKVIVTKQIEGWATAGTHTLKLKDGKLIGKYKDNKGNVGPLEFHRTKSHQN